MLISLRVENFGPFESATIEIKPLTILIGKNYVGKSLLLYLLWTLTSAYSSFEEVKSEWEPSIKIAEMIVNKVARGEPPRDELVEVTKILYNNVFKKAVEIGLNERFEYVFGVGIKELIKEGKNKALIELQSECGKLRLANEREMKAIIEGGEGRLPSIREGYGNLVQMLIPLCKNKECKVYIIRQL